MTKNNSTDALPVVAWKDGAVEIIDQTLLPGRCRKARLNTPADLHRAIRRLMVRGAPAIGCAAAYGVLLGLRHPAPDAGWNPLPGARPRPAIRREDRGNPVPGPAALRARCIRTALYLATSRPTAVNLFYALDRMMAAADRLAADIGRKANPRRPGAAESFCLGLLEEARAIHREDMEMGHRLAVNGLPFIRSIARPAAAMADSGARGADSRGPDAPIGVLTHCNAGRLASSGHGLALAPVYAAHAAGRRVAVYADETRPLCQGSRLTAWELSRAGIPVTVICDNMAAQVMREGRVDLVITGADRIAANGDAANKIGTYGLAILARRHGLPFYVVAPSTTFDLSLPDGGAIPIEQRPREEIDGFFGKPTAPREADVYNPAFDVTPARLITALITDRGAARRPSAASVARLFASAKSKP